MDHRNRRFDPPPSTPPPSPAIPCRSLTGHGQRLSSVIRNWTPAPQTRLAQRQTSTSSDLVKRPRCYLTRIRLYCTRRPEMEMRITRPAPRKKTTPLRLRMRRTTKGSPPATAAVTTHERETMEDVALLLVASRRCSGISGARYGQIVLGAF